MKLTKITTTGTKSTLTASDAVFAAQPNLTLVAQAIRVYLSNLRQGTSKVKVRSEVARTKSKWYRQKGTGNARHGSKNAPLFVGGGVAHGPTGNQNWRRTLPQQLKRKALISALSLQAEHILVLEGVEKLSGKTKEAVALLTPHVDLEKKVLVVVEEPTTEVVRSLRNLPQVMVTRVARLTALEVARADIIVMTPDAVTALTTRLETSAAKPVTQKEKKATKTK